jgi:hypothetical protein
MSKPLATSKGPTIVKSFQKNSLKGLIYVTCWVHIAVS